MYRIPDSAPVLEKLRSLFQRCKCLPETNPDGRIALLQLSKSVPSLISHIESLSSLAEPGALVLSDQERRDLEALLDEMTTRIRASEESQHGEIVIPVTSEFGGRLLRARLALRRC